MRVAGWLALSLLGWAWSTQAHAQGRADVPDPNQAGAKAEQVEEEARALFQAGRLAYESGRYEEALERFRAAHELTSLPALLYNVALAADRARYDEEALAAYERFLAESDPDEATRRQVEARIAGLRRASEREGSQKEQPSPTPANGGVPTPEETARADQPTSPPSSPVEPDLDDTDESTTGLSAWAWVGIGGGILAAGAAVLTAVLVTRSSSSVTPGDHGVVVTTLGAP
ncbi:MAG: hypothetical protein ACOC97_05230 [Myxococcota bacterium]